MAEANGKWYLVGEPAFNTKLTPSPPGGLKELDCNPDPCAYEEASRAAEAVLPAFRDEHRQLWDFWLEWRERLR